MVRLLILTYTFSNITNYDDDEIAQNCWLGQVNVALPDLDTERDDVVKMTGDWIKSVMSNFPVDALRIDAAKHVNTGFLPPFVKAANVFTMGEVYSGLIEKVCPYQDELQGLPNYPVWFPLIQAFTAGKMEGLAQMVNDVEKGCKNFRLLGTFTENHDIPYVSWVIKPLCHVSNVPIGDLAHTQMIWLLVMP
jgi:alpha-amylase